MNAHLRIARPVNKLEQSAAMYCRALGLIEIGRFDDHEGFDGVMLGRVGMDYHFEFTHCRSHPVAPSPTPEDLIVFYLSDRAEWERACEAMLEAGFKEVMPFNPYWGQRGRTFEDHDRYRVVFEQGEWNPSAGRPTARSRPSPSGSRPR